MEKELICRPGHAEIKTDRGIIRGYTWDHITVFKGVPYAKAERFHDPQPVDEWEGVLDCTSFGYVCPIPPMDKPGGELYVPHRFWLQDEDCLNLNIWTPGTDDEKRPVVVWFHGGGFENGSAIEHIAYEGENMARFGNVVSVTVNHRLNVLGYLDLSDFGEEYENSGNAGSSDLVMSLRWIHDNISRFGGDPDNVTIFGQSGGGAKVTTMLQTPAADGLYHRGFVMSGVIGSTLADAEGSGREFAGALMKELKVSDVKALEKVPYAELVCAYRKLRDVFRKAGKYAAGMPHPNRFYAGDPLVHGFRKETSQIPLLVGSVFGEFAGFHQQYMNLLQSDDKKEQEAFLRKILPDQNTDELIPLFEKAYPDRPLTDLVLLDTLFRKPEISYIRQRAVLNGCTYSYLFDQNLLINGRTVPWHCIDIPFVFHNTCLVPVTQIEGVTEKMEERIFGCFMNFVRNGAPSYEDVPEWHASDGQTEYTMLVGETWHEENDFDHALIEAASKKEVQEALAKFMSGGQIQH